MEALNRYLDPAILVPHFSTEERKAAIQTCLDYQTFSVCIQPCDIPLATQMCEGTDTAVCVVLGFPFGNQLTSSKVDEAKRYVDLGVQEIDMVANYGRAISGDWEAVTEDIAAVAEVSKAAGVVLKVIFETAQLDEETIRNLVEASVKGGADFVKTSTGFNGEGAKESDVKLMLDTAAGRVKVKPSGGVRDYERAKMFVEMGVHRLGVNWTACEAICGGLKPADQSGY